jgi:hypothetical protein
MDASVAFLLVLMNLDPVAMNTGEFNGPSFNGLEAIELFDDGEVCYGVAFMKSGEYNREYSRLMLEQGYMTVENKVFTCVPVIVDWETEKFVETLNYDGDMIDGQDVFELLKGFEETY